jgi:hypothetical protein
MSSKALFQLYRRALLQTVKANNHQRCFGSTTLKACWQRDEEHLQQLAQTAKAYNHQRCFSSTPALARWHRDEEHLQQLARERENIEKMEAEELRRLREREDSVVWLPPHAGISLIFCSTLL